jgi:hypothetical protein
MLDLSLQGQGLHALELLDNWHVSHDDAWRRKATSCGHPASGSTAPDHRGTHSPREGSIRGQVAQYYGIESMEGLGQKLGQFSEGTQFVLIVHGDGPEGATDRIRNYAAAHGLIVVSH